MKKFINEILFILFIVVMLFILTGKIPINDGSTIVISFFGILATFVVIGNYSQVRDIKQETKEEINSLKNHIKDEIDPIKKQVLDKDSPTSIVRQQELILSSLYDDRKKPILRILQNNLQIHDSKIVELVHFAKVQKTANNASKKMLSNLLYLEIGKQRVLVREVLINNQYKCNVQIEGQEQSVEANATWDNEKGIVFSDNEGRNIENVVRVASKTFNKQEIDLIIRELKAIIQI